MVRKLLTGGLPGAALTIPLAVHCFAQAQTNRDTVELSVQRQIMDLEGQGLEAAKKRDSSAVQRLLTADALDVGEYGIWDAKKSAGSIASLEKHPGSELAEYSVSGWKFRRAAENVVVVAYKVTLITMSNNVRQNSYDSILQRSLGSAGQYLANPLVSQLDRTCSHHIGPEIEGLTRIKRDRSYEKDKDASQMLSHKPSV
jgi:hypothetical protein